VFIKKAAHKQSARFFMKNQIQASDELKEIAAKIFKKA
jgi:hypothetical protein